MDQGGCIRGRYTILEEKPFHPPSFLDLPAGLPAQDVDQFFREQRLEELQKKLLQGLMEIAEPGIRPPSPPPTYDRKGARTNSLEQRVWRSMLDEHQALVEHFALNSAQFQWFRPPVDFKAAMKVMRIFIPQEKFPEYNFMGLIIGPRGCNHKRLEQESGALISIRGRGTLKEGKKTDHQSEMEANLPQHIHIAADDEEKVLKACRLIEPLLDPTHPQHELFKRQGLEQLAVVNGTGAITLNETRCNVCGAVGHHGWDCPDAKYQTFRKADVQCAFCGDKGHVTSDCKLVREKKLNAAQTEELEMRRQRTRENRERRVAMNNYQTDASAGGAEQLDQDYSVMMTDILGGRTSFIPSEATPTTVAINIQQVNSSHYNPQAGGYQAPTQADPTGQGGYAGRGSSAFNIQQQRRTTNRQSGNDAPYNSYQ